MNVQIVALLIQEGSRLLSQFLQTRPPSALGEPEVMTLQSGDSEIIVAAEPSKATDIATGCVPCAIGHLGTCTGLLNEAMRFARSDGIGSSEVIDRTNICLDELNAMERVDLRPEMIAQLPAWEKDIANKALDQSRATRHQLEKLSGIGDLEKVAATTQAARQDIGRRWFQTKIANMSPDEKAKLKQHAQLHIEQIISPEV